MSVEEIADQALQLPIEARARLADILAESLMCDPLSDFEQRWLDEAVRRIAEVESGRVVPIPGEEALRQVRESLRR